MPIQSRKINKIAFLGGAGWLDTDQASKDAYETAKLLALNSYEIVNGGGPGVMKAASMGAKAGNGKVLAITYHPNKPKRHYESVDPTNPFDEEIITLDYFDRTKVMLQNSDVHVIFNGSLGTISEFGMTWVSSWIHEPDHKPIVLFGDFWRHLIEFVREHMLLTHFEDHLLKICSSPQEVLDYIKSLN